MPKVLQHFKKGDNPFKDETFRWKLNTMMDLLLELRAKLNRSGAGDALTGAMDSSNGAGSVASGDYWIWAQITSASGSTPGPWTYSGTQKSRSSTTAWSTTTNGITFTTARNSCEANNSGVGIQGNSSDTTPPTPVTLTDSAGDTVDVGLAFTLEPIRGNPIVRVLIEPYVGGNGAAAYSLQYENWTSTEIDGGGYGGY